MGTPRLCRVRGCKGISAFRTHAHMRPCWNPLRHDLRDLRLSGTAPSSQDCPMSSHFSLRLGAFQPKFSRYAICSSKKSELACQFETPLHNTKMTVCSCCAILSRMQIDFMTVTLEISTKPQAPYHVALMRAIAACPPIRHMFRSLLIAVSSHLDSTLFCAMWKREFLQI